MRIWLWSLFAVVLVLCSGPVIAASRSADVTDQHQLWSLVEKLARAAEHGSTGIADAWPGAGVSMPTASTGRLQVIDGGAFQISPALRIQESEIRMMGSGELRLITLELGGACVAPADVARQFPGAELIRIPSPNNPNPRDYHRVNLGTVTVSFGFPRHAPKCLAGIILKTKLGHGLAEPRARHRR